MFMPKKKKSVQQNINVFMAMYTRPVRTKSNSLYPIIRGIVIFLSFSCMVSEYFRTIQHGVLVFFFVVVIFRFAAVVTTFEPEMIINIYFL